MATNITINIEGQERAKKAFSEISKAESERLAIFRNMNAQYARTADSVSTLTSRLRALTEARDKSFSPETIMRFNQKINETQAKINQLKTTGLPTTGAGAGKPTSLDLSPAKAQVGELSVLTSGLGRAVAGAFAVGQIVSFGSAVFETARKMQALETSIKFVSRTPVEFAKNMEFLRKVTGELGLDLESASRGFKTIASSALPAGMSADSVRKTFESVAKASTAMGLSAEETEGIFLALGQMISKGTVQAEELRGQLGERLPGAFNLAAQSMGVTTFQLNKMLEQGQVVTADFLPKFVAELDKTYSAGAKLGSDGLNANLNRLNRVGFLRLPSMSC
jgi:tape measure domain-containing protein